MASTHLQRVPVGGLRPRGAPIERRAGRLLRLTRDHQLYRSLGFVRLADYVLERPFGGKKLPPNLVDRRSPSRPRKRGLDLAARGSPARPARARAIRGLGYRTAQEMIRADEALESLPLAAGAFEAGEITAGHVRLLSREAAPESEAFWVGLARRSGVRELARAVAAARRGDLSSDEGAPAGRDGEERGRAAADGTVGGPADGSSESTRNDLPGEGGAPEAGLESLPIPAPTWIAGLWRDTVSLVRRLAGSDLPPGACLEMVLAEVAANVGVESEGDRDSLTSAPWASLEGDAAASHGTGGEAAGGRAINRKTSVAASELHASAPSGIPGAPDSSGPGENRTSLSDSASRPSAGVDGRSTADGRRMANGALFVGAEVEDAAAVPDAQEIDTELRHLVVERQRREAALAEHLRLVAIDRGYRDAGFTSLEHYAADRFGLAPRSLYHLLALGRVLRALPALRQSFLAGRVTARQSSLIGGVATSRSVDAWVRRAQRVTLRRLEDEVNFWVHLKETRPKVWELLDGRPLPEGLVLAPGQPARLHASASPPTSPSQAEPARLHASAFPADESRRLHASASSLAGLGPLHVSAPPGGEPPNAGAGTADREEKRPRPGEGSAISAAALLRALEEDESATPLPARLCCIRLRVEPGVSEMWQATLRYLRATVREDLAPWEALELVLREFLSRNSEGQ